MRKRHGTFSLFIELSRAERDQIHRIAKERGLTLRELIVSAVFDSEPPNLLKRLINLEARVCALETKT